MPLSRRQTVRRLIALAAGGAVLNLIVAWLSAYAAMLASPPTGQVRAAWVTALSSDMAVVDKGNLSQAVTSERGNFAAHHKLGVLASSTALLWVLTSARLEEPPSTAPVPGLGALTEAIDGRYRDEFVRWAAELNPIPGAPMAILEADSFGFPTHSLGHTMRTDYELEPGVSYPSYIPRFHINGGINASTLTTYHTPRPALVLPLIPRWPEFLVNTAFWSGVLWLIFGGARTLRGTWRRRRGRCGACGYDVRGLARDARCPECGQA